MRDRPTRGATSRPSEPDITVLIAMIAFAAISTMGLLALVIALPIGWVWFAGLVPVAFWALLLREIHRLLRSSGEAEGPGGSGS